MTTQYTRYISFCGTFEVPFNADALSAQFPLQYDTAFRDGLSYEAIDGKDSLTVYLAKVDHNTGHLVASCPAGGWEDETFVFLDNEGSPVKSAENFNLNPVRQLCKA